MTKRGKLAEEGVSPLSDGPGDERRETEGSSLDADGDGGIDHLSRFPDWVFS